MGLNNDDRKAVEKQAAQNGYKWSSDGSKMTNGNGGSVTFSSTGQSVNINGGNYNSSSDTNKSKKW